MIGPVLADLHRHLDGSLRRARLGELPEDFFFHRGMGLGAALARFELTLSVLQEPETVERVAAEICDDAAAEGVTTLEIRFAPQLHRGAPIEAVIEAAVAGAAGRAGIIVCGLYGEPPELVERLAVEGAARGAVGIDLAGGPSTGDAWSLADYAPAFRRAAELGLGRTVHAGEGRPAAEIRAAVETLGAQRIGHGTTLLEDPSLVELVVARGVTIEACLTSNLQTGAIASLDEHPLPRWLAAGVRACICTDNALLSQVDSPGEHARAAALPGMTPALLARAIQHGHDAAFAAQGFHTGSRPRRA